MTRRTTSTKEEEEKDRMWQSALIPGFQPEGKPILSVLAKKTYCITPGKLTPSDKQIPLVQSDVYEDPGNPGYCEVESETDFVAFKLTTDVIVKGRVFSPSGKRAYFLDCSLKAGSLHKIVRVYGNRRVKSKGLGGLCICDPQPFTEMELGYKHAYGGVAAARDGTLYPYLPNPIGKGLNFKGGYGDPESIEVPNLEDPLSPVTADNIVLSKPKNWINAPKPSSFGWTRRNFYPRYTFAGILPQKLQSENGAQDVNSNVKPGFDFRFYQGASEGLSGETLKGDELVEMQFFDKDNQLLQFQLPGEIPVIELDAGNGPGELSSALQTVIIDMNCKLLSVVWRGSGEFENLQQIQGLRRLDYRVY